MKIARTCERPFGDEATGAVEDCSAMSQVSHLGVVIVLAASASCIIYCWRKHNGVQDILRCHPQPLQLNPSPLSVMHT